VALLAIAGVFVSAAAAHAPDLGSGFADVYSAFAPIYALHASYGDYLFFGIPVIVPADLGGACERFLRELADLHLTWSIQTKSIVPIPISMIPLRVEADAFCADHGEMLNGIAAWTSVDLDVLQSASAAGLFARTYEVNGLLDAVFTETFDALDEAESCWAFAVTFATRTLVDREILARIDENLSEVFYGGEDRSEPPFDVPEEVSQAMDELVDLCGRDLDATEAAEALEAAETVYDYFVGG
jgi:hypothetical protein